MLRPLQHSCAADQDLDAATNMLAGAKLQTAGEIAWLKASRALKEGPFNDISPDNCKCQRKEAGRDAEPKSTCLAAQVIFEECSSINFLLPELQ